MLKKNIMSYQKKKIKNSFEVVEFENLKNMMKDINYAIEADEIEPLAPRHGVHANGDKNGDGKNFTGSKWTVIGDELNLKDLGGCYAFMPYDRVDSKDNALFKVGMSINFEKRLQGYNTYYPLGVYITALFVSPDIPDNPDEDYDDLDEDTDDSDSDEDYDDLEDEEPDSDIIDNKNINGGSKSEPIIITDKKIKAKDAANIYYKNKKIIEIDEAIPITKKHKKVVPIKKPNKLTRQKQHYMKVEEFIFEKIVELNGTRIYSTNFVKKREKFTNKGATEWFYCSEDIIHEAFNLAGKKFSGGEILHYYLRDGIDTYTNEFLDSINTLADNKSSNMSIPTFNAEIAIDISHTEEGLPQKITSTKKKRNYIGGFKKTSKNRKKK